MVRVHPGGGGAPGDLQSKNQAGNVDVTVTAGQRWELVAIVYFNNHGVANTLRFAIQYGGVGGFIDIGGDQTIAGLVQAPLIEPPYLGSGRMVVKDGDVLRAKAGLAAGDTWTITYRVV